MQSRIGHEACILRRRAVSLDECRAIAEQVGELAERLIVIG
jgi:hypothetical protein